MNMSNWIGLKDRQSWFWLTVISISLIAIYVVLVWQSGDIAHLGMSLLFGVAAGMLFWEKRGQLRFGSTLFCKLLGGMLIGWMICQSIGSLQSYQNSLNPVLRLFPVISALGMCLFVSGASRLRQHWQELTILFFLGTPSIIASFLPDISPITAKFSGYLLWYSGFQVTLTDSYINLPTGAVQVYSGCSGLESMTYLLGLSAISLIMFPVSRFKQITIPLLALLIGFTVNGIRVALMAVLAASQNRQAFDYWHEGDGSLIFGAAAVLIFWGVQQLLQREPANRNVENS